MTIVTYEFSIYILSLFLFLFGWRNVISLTTTNEWRKILQNTLLHRLDNVTVLKFLEVFKGGFLIWKRHPHVLPAICTNGKRSSTHTVYLKLKTMAIREKTNNKLPAQHHPTETLVLQVFSEPLNQSWTSHFWNSFAWDYTLLL